MIRLRQEASKHPVFFAKNVIDPSYVDVVYPLCRIVGAKIRDVWRSARYIWRRIELDQLLCNGV